MTRVETGWLDGPPVSETMLALIRVDSPHVRICLLYAEWTCWTAQVTSPSPPRTLEAARDRWVGTLRDAGVDPDRVDVMPTPLTGCSPNGWACRRSGQTWSAMAGVVSPTVGARS